MLAVTQISNLYSVDIAGKKHYVEDQLILSDTKVLFCDVWYAGANVPYINLNLYNRVGDNLSLSKTIKMFPFEDFSGGRTFGISTEKLWQPQIPAEIEVDTVKEETAIEGEISYSMTVPSDVNEKVGPVRSTGDYSYYDYTPPQVTAKILYKRIQNNTWFSANGESEIYALVEYIEGDTITIEEV
jgi:hypothetical protein